MKVAPVNAWMRKWWRYGIAAAGVLLIAALIIEAIAGQGVLYAAGVAAIIALLQIVYGIAQWPFHNFEASTPAQVENAAIMLQKLARNQWLKICRERQLERPTPLCIYWGTPKFSVADHAELIGRGISGRTDRMEHLCSRFTKLKKQRLVILGQPGSGKTCLSTLLALQLLKDWQPGKPIPVMLSMSSWNPARGDLRLWMERRIGRDYATLRDNKQYGSTAIHDLIADNKIMPVLDGLDELPRPQRAKAITAINNALDRGDSFMVTCRTAEYQEAVAAGGVLAAAAVVEPQEIHTQDAIKYLRLSVPPGPRLERLEPVFSQLRCKGSPLSLALSTPLMVWTTKLVLEQNETDPSHLANTVKFSSRTEVEAFLLNALVPALLKSHDKTDPAGKIWDSQNAARWLAFLAAHLSRMNTYDLAWWELRRELPAVTANHSRAILAGLIVTAIGGITYGITTGLNGGAEYGVIHGPIHGLAFGVATAIACWLAPATAPSASASTTVHSETNATRQTIVVGLACGFAYGLITGLLATFTYGLKTGLTTGVGYGLVVGVAYGFAFNAGVFSPPSEPIRAAFGLRGRSAALAWTLAWGITCGATVGVLIGAAEQLLTRLGFEPKTGMVFGDNRTTTFAFWPGIIFGLAFGLVFGLVRWARLRVAPDEVTSPRSLLRSDRGYVLFRSGMLTITTALAVGLAAISINTGFAYTLLHLGAIEAGVMAGTVAALNGSWPLYCAAVAWLAFHKMAPWRFMRFLRYCHQQGILIQLGPIYKFRHANLQDYLAESTISNNHGNNPSMPDPFTSGKSQSISGRSAGAE